MNARMSSSLKPGTQMVGIAFILSSFAAACLAWPAKIIPVSSTSTTPMKPMALIALARSLILRLG